MKLVWNNDRNGIKICESFKHRFDGSESLPDSILRSSGFCRILVKIRDCYDFSSRLTKTCDVVLGHSARANDGYFSAHRSIFKCFALLVFLIESGVEGDRA